jgi:hypothetical protein
LATVILELVTPPSKKVARESPDAEVRLVPLVVENPFVILLLYVRLNGAEVPRQLEAFFSMSWKSKPAVSRCLPCDQERSS